MQKVLIFTVTAGAGHNAVANALKQKLTQLGKTVKVVDIFKEYDKKFKQLLVNDAYLLASSMMPNIFNMFFEHYSNANPNNRDKGATQDFLKDITPHILKTIYKYKPDVILSTHFYPAIVITNLRKVYPIKAKVVSFLTDYVVHPFWESAIGVDYIITPSPHLTDTLIYKGYKKSQIKCLGYPILEKFTQNISKENAHKKLKLDNNILTVCVTCGGFGSPKMPKLIKKLLKVKHPLQIISICGKNKLSKQKIDKIAKSQKVLKSNKKILNYGFSNEIELLFSASDIMVSKGGCTFINEAMSKTLPQIFIRDLPMQEYYNAEYLKDNNAGLVATKHFDIDKIVNMVCANPQIIEDLKQNIVKIRKPTALNSICEFICKFDEVDSYADDILHLKSYTINRKIRQQNHKNKQNKSAINIEYKTYKKITRIKKSSKIYKNKLFRLMDKKIV